MELQSTEKERINDLINIKLLLYWIMGKTTYSRNPSTSKGKRNI